jgi:hypothetical protein
MRRAPRALTLVTLAACAVVAAFLPLYPLREETRSFMTGGGGDVIQHSWSLRTLPGALEPLRYRSGAEPLEAFFVAWCALLTIALFYVCRRLHARFSG